MAEGPIIIKTPEQIEQIALAGKIVAEFLDEIMPNFIKAGLKTIEIDDLAQKFALEKGAHPSFLDVPGYHHATCVSINEQVVHAIPGNRIIKDGDIVKVDIGYTYNGFIGDATRTYKIGDFSKKADDLVEVTRQALKIGIEQVKPGNRIGDIGSAIQRFVERNRFSVVREYVGHGVGIKLHEAPSVPHYGNRHTGLELKEGMVLAIEPMINQGTWRTKRLNDGWTVVTQDGKLSAQFENTVAVTKTGYRVLTER